MSPVISKFEAKRSFTDSWTSLYDRHNILTYIRNFEDVKHIHLVVLHLDGQFSSWNNFQSCVDLFYGQLDGALPKKWS